MIRTIVLLAGVAATALLLTVGASARPAAKPKATLQGTVGPGFTISLKRKGRRVPSLKAGLYRFAIADKASSHNFSLERESGGKFEKDLTTVSFVGKKTVTVRLKKGRWKYYCTPHESSMFGFFRVK